MKRGIHGEVEAARVGDLWITVMPDRPLDDATWRAHLDVSVEEVATNGPYAGLLVWAPRHGPAAHQRRVMTEEYGPRLCLDRQKACAIVTESAVVRGIMTALSWLGRSTALNAFPPSDVGGAFDWLARYATFDRKLAEEALRALTGLGRPGQSRSP